MKKIIIILSILLAVVIAVFAFNKVETKPKYKLSKIERTTIVETVEASGTINPVKTVSIGSQVSGIISEIYVDFNSKVIKGQLLAQIDPSLLQAQVDKARGDLNSARANYQKTKSLLVYDKKNYDRYKTLYQKHYVSRDELDLAEATYRSNLAVLNSMKIGRAHV